MMKLIIGIRVAEVGKQAQKMPSILSSDAYLLIRDKKRCFFCVLPKLQQKGSFYLVLPIFYLVLLSLYLVLTSFY